MDTLDLKISPDSREIMGNSDRFKNWVDFKDSSALIKEEFIIDEPNASIYSELIVEELAKQIGLDCAHTDLITYRGFRGILSQNLLKENEEMFSIDSLIGNTKIHPDAPELTDLIEVQEKMIEALHKEGYSKKEIRTVIFEFQKKIMFSIFTLLTDGHLENMSLIQTYNPETGKKNIKNSGFYDCENGLQLDLSFSLLQKLLSNSNALEFSCDTACPKIAAINAPFETQTDIIINTINSLLAVDEIYDFSMDCYDTLNIQKAIQSVENRLHCKLPIEVSSMAIKAFEYRRDFIDKVMCQEIQTDIVPEYIDPNDLDR